MALSPIFYALLQPSVCHTRQVSALTINASGSILS